MTRTGASVTLSKHIGEPFVEINPVDAERLRLHDACLVDVVSDNGLITVRALITPRTPVGSVFVPMHWTRQFASNARVNVLVDDRTDPVSGQPALKSQYVSLRQSAVASYGFLLTRNKPVSLDIHDYWATTPIEHGWKTEFASVESTEEVIQKLISLNKRALPDADVVSYSDKATSSFRYSWFVGQQLMQAVYLSSEPVAVARQAMVTIFIDDLSEQNKRLAVVSGAGLADRQDTGATVCSCLNVGSKTIHASIESGCHTVEQVGTACGAGTQCGSCRSEISVMLKEIPRVRSLEKQEL